MERTFHLSSKFIIFIIWLPHSVHELRAYSTSKFNKLYAIPFLSLIQYVLFGLFCFIHIMNIIKYFMIVYTRFVPYVTAVEVYHLLQWKIIYIHGIYIIVVSYTSISLLLFLQVYRKNTSWLRQYRERDE